jgi:hypothetical protein
MQAHLGGYPAARRDSDPRSGHYHVEFARLRNIEGRIGVRRIVMSAKYRDHFQDHPLGR